MNGRYKLTPLSYFVLALYGVPVLLLSEILFVREIYFLGLSIGFSHQSSVALLVMVLVAQFVSVFFWLLWYKAE